MFASSVQTLTGQSSVASSWDALLKYFNQKKGKGNIGYASGETVAIKINHVNTYSQTKTGTAIDCCAETLLAVVEQLVTAGVPQNNIIVYANGNGTIDIVDALLVAQYYVGLNPANFVSANADVNKDGKIDIVDALRIAQYYVGMITSFWMYIYNDHRKRLSQKDSLFV